MLCQRFLLGMVLALLLPVIARGNEFHIVPSLSIKEEYNSNIFFSTADLIQEDFITTISPGLGMVNRSERFDADLLARLGRLDYSKNRDLNATNYDFFGKARYQFSPLFVASAEAGYVKNSNATAYADPVGIVTATAPLNRISSALSAQYQFAEKTAGIASYRYGRDDYNKPGNVDNESHDVILGLIHDISESVKGRVDIGYRYIWYPDSLTETVWATMGFSKDFSEIWSFHVDAGSRNTWSTTTVVQRVPSEYLLIDGQSIPFAYHPARVEIHNNDLGWVGKASLNYRGERGYGDLNFLEDIAPASGLSGAAERTALALSARYRLSHELSLLFGASYSFLRSQALEFSGPPINQRTSYGNAGIRYAITKDTYLDTSYEYTRIEYQSSHTEANRQIISIRFFTQYSFFEWI